MSARPPHAIKALLSAFDALYQEAHGARYPFSGGKDSKTIKDLRAVYPDEDIRRYMGAFFQMHDSFIEKTGHSLGAFRGCLPQVIQFVQRQQPRMYATSPTYASWRDECAALHDPPCQHAEHHKVRLEIAKVCSHVGVCQSFGEHKSRD